MIPQPTPLPRRMTPSDGPYVAEYLQAAFQDENIAGTPRDALIDRLAREAAISGTGIRRVLDGRVSLPPGSLWRLGEALRRLGVSWCSGLGAVAAAPSYRGHVLSAVRALLAAIPSLLMGPSASEDARRLFPALAFILLESDITRRAEIDALADFPGAAQPFSLNNWLSARQEWRHEYRPHLELLADEPFAATLTAIWNRHLEAELKPRKTERFALTTPRGDEGTDIALLDEAIDLERNGASMWMRARLQNEIDDMLDSIDRSSADL